MAFQLIGHLASQGTTVPEEVYNDIHTITQIGERNVTPEVEHRFWAAYAKIVDLLGPDEDPEGIYYTAMFEHPRDTNMSVTTAFHQRWLTIYSRGIAVIALTVLFTLVLSLAYGTAVNNILQTLSALDSESLSIQSGNFSNTRVEGIADPNCFRPQNGATDDLHCGDTDKAIDRTLIAIEHAKTSSISTTLPLRS